MNPAPILSFQGPLLEHEQTGSTMVANSPQQAEGIVTLYKRTIALLKLQLIALRQELENNKKHIGCFTWRFRCFEDELKRAEQSRQQLSETVKQLEGKNQLLHSDLESRECSLRDLRAQNSYLQNQVQSLSTEMQSKMLDLNLAQLRQKV